MLASELEQILHDHIEEFGDREVLLFDTQSLISRPIISIKFTEERDFKEDLKNEPLYVENFNRELNKLTIL